MTNPNEKILELAAPGIPDALPNFPDSQVNLLPVRALVSPLKISIPDWSDSLPNPDESVNLMLLLNGNIVADYDFTGPINPGPFPFDAHIPESYIYEGVHKVSYTVISGEISAESESTQFTVDLTAPNSGNPGESPQFPAEIIREGITQRYLEANNDEVLVTIATYMQQRACDSIEFSFGSLTAKPIITETVHDATLPVVIKLSGTIIRGIGSGNMFAFYRLRDRAGNIGPQSDFARINVDLS